MSNLPRKIIHIDMDCFYAAIEMRDNPQLVNKPIAVGGDASGRGVLCTANYTARQFGIHAAMSTARALQILPELIVLPVNMQKYVAESALIRDIFYQFTDIVEPLSLDEAFLDVTEVSQVHGSATAIAELIRSRIFQQRGITASAGIASNKFLAKIASDWHKPNGQFVIPPGKVNQFMQQLPVEKIFGVGKVTCEKMHGLGIQTCADLQQWPITALTREFGSFGNTLYELCRGQDSRAVETRHSRKSISIENTFSVDLTDHKICINAIHDLHNDLAKRIKAHAQRQIKSIVLKLKFNDFSLMSCQTQSRKADAKLFELLYMQKIAEINKPIRLIGIGVQLEPENYATGQQLELDLKFIEKINFSDSIKPSTATGCL